MAELKGYQKKYLRGLAHGANPNVYIGQKGITDMVVKETEEALERHELIKIKFVDLKDKSSKKECISILEEKTGCELAGMVGHTAVFYRPHPDPAKRKVKVPNKES